MRNSLRLLAALAPLCLLSTSCIVAAGAVGGTIISQERIDEDALETLVDRPVREVWPIVKSYMSNHSADLIEVDEEHTTARASLYAARVTVKVYGYNEHQTMLLVVGKKAGFDDANAEVHVTEQLLARLRE